LRLLFESKSARVDGKPLCALIAAAQTLQAEWSTQQTTSSYIRLHMPDVLLLVLIGLHMPDQLLLVLPVLRMCSAWLDLGTPLILS
jgi:hypothetical protein